MQNAKLKTGRPPASRSLAFLIFNFAFLISTAFAHDPLEITATVYLHTNRIELRAVMMRKAILLAADHQGVPLLDFSIAAERDEALPMLRSLAPGLFALTCGTNVLTATETNVILGAEDHVGFNLTFPKGLMDEWRDGLMGDTGAQASDLSNHPIIQSFNHPPSLRLDARLLAHLPAQDPYGVSLTVLDLVNNQVLEQKLLNASDPVTEIALPPAATTNQPPAAKKPAAILP